MPLFVVQCTDHENVIEKRLAARPQHLSRLQALQAQGDLLIAGPMPKDPDDLSLGFYGSTIIVNFASRQALDKWLTEEPYLVAGVYKHIDVKPFIKALPKDE